MKQCSRCKIKKDDTAFYRDKRTKDGLYSGCKTCHQENKSPGVTQLESIKTNPKPEVVASYLMGNIRSRIKQLPYYKNIKLLMSKEEMLGFIKDNWLTYMHHNEIWRENNFRKKYSPALDRIDPEGHYEISNIQIISFSENCSRGRRIKKHTRV